MGGTELRHCLVVLRLRLLKRYLAVAWIKFHHKRSAFDALIVFDMDRLDRAVHAGRKTISADASYELTEHATDEALTPAEVRVLRLIAAGDSNKEIAEQLSISEETVKGQVRNILSKLGAKDRTHAAMIGLKRGIIEA